MIIKYCMNDFIKDLESIESDLQKIETSAGYADTRLHATRRRLENLIYTKTFILCYATDSTIDDFNGITERLYNADKKIKDLLQNRIFWIANGIDSTIAARKEKGSYKGEFSTAMIIANAFNDIFEPANFKGVENGGN